MKPATGMLAVTLLMGALSGCGRGQPQSESIVAIPSSTDVVVRGRIDIEGGQLSLTTLVDGVIAEVAVHEGEHVSKGQALLTMRPLHASTKNWRKRACPRRNPESSSVRRAWTRRKSVPSGW